MKNYNYKFYLAFILLGFILTVPAFFKGLIPTDDIFVYSSWHQSFSCQFWAGEWYPKWLVDMNGGRGSAVFFFYPPFPFFVSALMGLFTPVGSPAWFPIYLSYGFALGISGVTAFLWLRHHTEKIIAFSLALFYMLAPYHLFVNFYHRFAYPEFWAFTWAPLLFLSLDKFLASKRKYSFSFSVAYALLLLTHLPSLIILTPALLLYAFVFSTKKVRVLYVTLSMFLSFCLSAFYVLPMIMYQPFISLGKMWQGKYALFNNFFQVAGGFDNSFLLKITLVNLFVLLSSCLAIDRPIKKHVLFWLITGFFSTFLMFKVSVLFWEFTPLINKIQFPWRLNLLTLLAVVAVSMEAVRRRRFPGTLVIVVLCVQVVAVFMQLLPLQKVTLSDGQMSVVSHETDNRLGVVEYLPRWVPEEIYQDMKYRRLGKVESRADVQGEGSLSVVQWSPREIMLQSSSEHGFDALIRQFYFPYWQATVQDKKDPLEIRPGRDGLINIPVPPGRHTIRLELIKGRPELFGIWISLLTIAAIVFWQAKTLWSKQTGFKCFL